MKMQLLFDTNIKKMHEELEQAKKDLLEKDIQADVMKREHEENLEVAKADLQKEIEALKVEH